MAREGLSAPNGSLQQDTFSKLMSGVYANPNSQLVPMISRAETAPIANDYMARTANNNIEEDQSDGEEDFIDASESLSGGTAPAPEQSQVIDVSGDDEEADAQNSVKSRPATPDLFRSVFGNNSNREQNDADDHADGCVRTNPRLSTPPLPDPDVVMTGAATITKKEKTTPPRSKQNWIWSQEGRTRKGPDLDRDLSPTLRRHQKFHDRVIHLIPRLNAHGFDWSRRYWIAVLILGKNPKNATSEKDFVWLQGHRLSTGMTIWHKYIESTMADSETTVLMFGTERLGMQDTMEECDFFGDRFVLLRAVEEGSERAKTKSLIDGLIPPAPQFVDISEE